MVPMVPIPTKNDMVDFAKKNKQQYTNECLAYIGYLKIGNFLKPAPLEPAKNIFCTKK